jgi:hypothetical protein
MIDIPPGGPNSAYARHVSATVIGIPMAKGQVRGNRETKKPKQPKKPAAPVLPWGNTGGKSSLSSADAKKK